MRAPVHTRMIGIASLLAAIVMVVALAAPAAHAESALFDLGLPGPAEIDGDTAAVELGTRITVASVPYLADGVTFYRPPGHEASNVVVHLWEDGTLVRSGVTGTSPTGSWVHVRFAEGPFYMTPGHEYVAGYAVPSGQSYVDTPGFFSEPYAPSVLGLRTPENGGVYRYLDGGPDVVPADTWEASNYWVSVYGDSIAVRQGTGAALPLFDGSTPIAEPASDDDATVELGVRFSVSEVPSGSHADLTKVRFYRAPNAGMVENRVFVYDQDGALLRTGVAIGEGPRSGIVDVALNSPLRLEVGKTYTASYLAVDGRYPENRRGFAIGGKYGMFRYPADAGVYSYGGGFPTDSWESTDYYVSPIAQVSAGA